MWPIFVSQSQRLVPSATSSDTSDGIIVQISGKRRDATQSSSRSSGSRHNSEGKVIPTGRKKVPLYPSKERRNAPIKARSISKEFDVFSSADEQLEYRNDAYNEDSSARPEGLLVSASPRTPRRRKRTLLVCGSALSNPQCSIWKGREHCNLAIVVPAFNPKDSNDFKSISPTSEQSDIGGTKDESHFAKATRNEGVRRKTERTVRKADRSSPSHRVAANMATRTSKLHLTLRRPSKSLSPSTTSCATEINNHSDLETQSNVSSFHNSQTDSTSADELATDLETTQSESASSRSKPSRKRLKLSCEPLLASISSRLKPQAAKYANAPHQKARVPARNSTQSTAQDSSDSGDIIQKQSIIRCRNRENLMSPELESNLETDAAIAKGERGKYQDNFKYSNGIDEIKPPLYTITEIFADLTSRALEEGLDKFINHLAGRPLVIATMMSGTESPVITLNNVSQHLKTSGRSFNFSHAFSAEIEPFKQNYILRNFPEPTVFRDVVELNNHSGFATTAYGGLERIPGNVDLLVAGFCCVDFSPLNNAQKTLEARGESGDTFFSIIAYAKDFNPKMIILENLCSVAWSHEEVLEKKKKEAQKDVEKAKKEVAKAAKNKSTEKSTSHNNKRKINGDLELEENNGKTSCEGGSKTNGTANNSSEKVGLDKYFKDIGYRSIHIRLDTKEHYIPQTRVRGYMVAVHEASYPDPEKLDGLLQGWQKLIKKLKSTASVPVEAMIMACDDPRLSFRTQRVADPDKKTVDWERCKTGHHDYRAALGLGTRHPLSNWSSDGYVSFPDFFKPYFGRTERVFDSLEIAHLRNIRRGLDDRYFSRFYELSQNVFRVCDTNKQGIIGCLTPTGIPWSSIRGGRLSGQEALMLQGLPVDQLDLDQLSQSQLQDFSGNAMTSTVVGTAMLAAFITFYRIFDSGDNAMQTNFDVRAVEPTLDGESILEETLSHPTNYVRLPVSEIMKLADLTRRLCYCEGRHDVLSKPFQECTTCKHTTCIACGKTPRHHYIPIAKNILRLRQDPCVFSELIKKSIPMKIDLHYMLSFKADDCLNSWNKIHPEGFRTKEWLDVITKVRTALSSQVFFRSCRRSEIWEIIYDSSVAKVVLQISNDLVEWLVYTHVPTEPLGTPCGKFLRKHPIARMRPTGQDIVQGQWEFWIPERRDFVVEIASGGELVQSFESYCGLEAFAETAVREECNIKIFDYDASYFDSDIRGHYELSQNCGQAFNSLHVRKDTPKSSRPTFFFFDHHLQSGNPKTHSFVFSHTVRRMNYGEHRPSLAAIDSKWRQPKVLASDITNQTQTGLEKDMLNSQKTKRDRTTIRSEGRWVVVKRVEVKEQELNPIAYKRLPVQNVALDARSCHSHLAVFIATTTMPCVSGVSWPREQWTAVDRSNEEAFSREFHWAFENGAVLSGYQQADKNWQTIESVNARCYGCTPLRPRLLWAFHAHKDKLGKLAPYEEPEEATAYGHAMKKRPSPITVLYRVGKDSEVTFKVGINPVTLIHRAVALLEAKGFSTTLILSWRLVTNGDRIIKPTLAPFKLMNTKSLPMSPQPPNFNKELQLRDFQRSSLTWMVDQESPDLTFTEQEVCEAKIRTLGYRLEGKATRKVRALGGVLAHDVGFGKTALILALIDTMKARDARRAQGQRNINGAIPLKATLIMVPPHLLDQWESEINRFLPQVNTEELLVIKSIAGFQKLSINQWMNAEIVVISWKMCDSAIYASGLAQFAGMMEPDDHSTSRAKDAWYEDACKRVAQNVERLTSDPKGFRSHLKLETDASQAESMSLVAPVPSKRTKGASYKNFAEREIERANKNKIETKIKITAKDRAKKNQFTADFNLTSISKSQAWMMMTFPPLEIFDFARVVVDEYTYVAKGEGRILEHVKANARWILSGTPSLGGFWHIKKMAKLLGINLGIDDFTSMPEDILKVAINEMTRAEEAQIYKEIPSSAWQEYRHLLCQKFLDQYVRKDLADVSDISCSEHIRLIRQPPAEKAIYLELVQTMAAVDFMPRNNKASGKEVDRHIDDVLANCTDGREALLLRASHFAVLPRSNENDLTENETEDDVDADDSDAEVGIVSEKHLKRVRDEGTDPESAPKACDIVVQSRRRHYDHLMKDFHRVLKQTYWLHRNAETRECDYYTKWQERIRSSTFGDIEICEEVKGLIEQVETTYHPDDWKLFYYRGKPVKGTKLAAYPTGLNDTHGVSHLPKMVFALRTMATKLNTFMGTLIKRKRALRLMETVLAVQSFKPQLVNVAGLSCSKCSLVIRDVASIIVLTQCGHLVCRQKCLHMNADECPVKHCRASVKKYHQTLGSDLIDVGTCGKLSRNGEKLDAIVSLIEYLPEDEKILIFVQSVSLMEKVMEAVGAKMLYSDIESVGNARKKNGSRVSVRRPYPENARDLAAFQSVNTVHKKGRSITNPRVLILNVGTEAASGLNLTMANHIIFVAPYYAKGSNAQHDHEAAMTQAIGRARRYGQTKPVHVYHFMTCHTIDVDIFEYRSSRLVKPVAAMPLGPLPYSGFVPSKLELVERREDDRESTFGSAIAQMLFDGGNL